MIFIHIPKTAGRYFVRTLRKSGKTVRAYDIVDWEKLDVLPLTPEVLTGHIKFREFSLKAVRDAGNEFARAIQYVTILREPVERVISHYCFVKGSTNVLAPYAEGTLKEYVLNRFAEVCNWQVKALAGVEDPHTKITEIEFEQAKENLQSFAAVGITEELDKFLIQVSGVFQWKLRKLEFPANVTENRLYKKDFTEDDLQTVRDFNQWDIRLYEWVRDYFDI